MDPSWMELVLDSIKNYEVQTKQLFEQQQALHLQALNVMVSTEPPPKRLKDSKQCYKADGKENIFTSGIAHNKQSISKRVNSSKRKIKERTALSNVERNLNFSEMIYFKEADEGKIGGGELRSVQQDPLDDRNLANARQSDEVEMSDLAIPPQIASLEIVKSIRSSPKLKSGRGRKRGGAFKTEALSVVSQATASTSAEELDKVNNNSKLPCPVAATAPTRMTRARAKIMGNGEGDSVCVQSGEPAKKPKGRAKALPLSNSGREVEELAEIVTDVRVADEKSTKTELVLSRNVALSVVDELRNQSTMNSVENVDTGNLSEIEQRVMMQSSKFAAVCKTIPANCAETQMPAVVNLQLLEETQFGCETIQVYVEDQSGSEIGPTEEQIKSPDDSITAIRQTEHQVNISCPQKGIGRAESQAITAVCQQGNVGHGVANAPSGLVSDLKIESVKEVGMWQSGEAEVFSDDGTDGVVGGGDTVIALVEKLVKKTKSKRVKPESLPKEMISIPVETNLARCTGAPVSGGEKHLEIMSSNVNGDRHNWVADDDGMNLAVGAYCQGLLVGQAKPSLSHEDEEIKDVVVTDALRRGAEGNRVVTSHVDGIVHREKERHVGIDDVSEAEEKKVGNANLQESQPVFETDGGVKRPQKGRRRKESLNAVSKKTSSKVDVNDSPEDTQPAEVEDPRNESVWARDDRYHECVEADREDEYQLFSEDLYHKRWEDIERSAKVRKGRGKAVSSFMEYDDSDLFPPRILALGCDDVIDTDLELGSKHEVDGRCSEGRMGRAIDTARPFSDLLQEMEAAACDSSQKNPQRESELGRERNGDVEGRRQCDFSRCEKLVSRRFALSEELSCEAVKSNLSVHTIHEASMASGKHLARIPVICKRPEEDRADKGDVGSVVTPEVLSRGSGPISESLERSVGAVVSGRGLRHLVKELKLELESTEHRRLNTEIIIDLSPEDGSGIRKQILQENPCLESGYNTGWTHDGAQVEQIESSTSKEPRIEGTVDLTGDLQVHKGELKIRSCDKQGLQMFANIEEMVSVYPTPPEDLEPNVVPEIEKFTFVSLEHVRRLSGYRGGDASPGQDSGIRGIKLRTRPYLQFCGAKVSSPEKVRSAFTSLEGEYQKLGPDQAVSPVEIEESLTLNPSQARSIPAAESRSPIDTTPSRGNDSPSEGGTPNRRPPVISLVKINTSRAHATPAGELNLFKEVFTLKTPLRSQRRNVAEVSASCQPMGHEASPPFHVPDARRSCRSGPVNNRLSISQKRRTSRRVGKHADGSGVKTGARAASPPEEFSTRVGVSGGGLRYESARGASNIEMTDTLAKLHIHQGYLNPARVDFRDESGLKKSVYEGQYKRCRFGTPDSVQKGRTSGNEARAVPITPHGLLGDEILPLNGVGVAVSLPQQLSSENVSGDTMVLTDEDDGDTLCSRPKSLGSSRQTEKRELPVCYPCQPETLSLSMNLTLQDLSPPNVPTSETYLAVKEIENLSSSKCSQQYLEHKSGLSCTELKGDKSSEHNSVRNSRGSGGFAERLERSKRDSDSPLFVEPKRLRLSKAEGPGKSFAREPVNSELVQKVIKSVTAAESFQRAGADVHSGSTVYVSDEDEGFGAESSGNASIESRRMSEFKREQGDEGKEPLLGGRQPLDTEKFPGENEFPDEPIAFKEGADLSDVEECSGDSEAGTEELVGPRKPTKQMLESYGRKSTSRKRKEQDCTEESTDFHQQNRPRHEAEAHNLSRCSSYEGDACSILSKGCSENSSARRTQIQDTACGRVERYVRDSDVGDLDFKSDYPDFDTSRPVSSYGKACVEETSTAKAERSSERSMTNSNILNPFAQSTRASNVRTLIPVIQRQAPNFIPNGKRDVKVKALEAADAARRLQEKREMEKRERMQKRAEAIARRALEKEKAKEETLKAEHDFKVAQKAVSDSTTAKDLLGTTVKAVLTDCTNFKSLQSPKTKSTRALALKTKIEQEKAKKLEEELRRKEEERRKKEAETLARKRRREEAEKKDREEKRRRQEDMMKQRREQEERLRADLEEKEHRHRLLEEAERERKAQEEGARRQRRAERERERERRQKEELEAKAARQAEKEAERKRKEEVFLICKASEEHDHRVAESMGAAGTAPILRSQHSTGLSTDKLRASNLLSTGASLSFGKAARVPSTAVDGRTHTITTPMVQNKGPTISLSVMNPQSLGNGPSTAGKNPQIDIGRKTFATPTLAAVGPDDTGPQSYEISPYKSSSDDDDEDKPERPKKFIPAWASKENLLPQLLRQLTQDPDETFTAVKTCSLKEVFGTNGSKKVHDFSRRSGSGDWVKDRVSWKEELQYKMDMGYMSHIH